MSAAKTSYSQSGEDLIIEFIFNTLNVNTRRYMDVGANHPTELNNTYLFYLEGHRGISVEPDPNLAEPFAKARPEDILLSVGVGKNNGKLPFYVLNPTTLSTFSEKEVEAYKKYYPWTKVENVIDVKIVDINQLIKKYFAHGLDFLSIDTEGMDDEIISAVDFNKYRPLIICVETAVYIGERALSKNKKLVNYLRSKDYFVYADTFVNTILVDYKAWLEHKGPKLEGF